MMRVIRMRACVPRVLSVGAVSTLVVLVLVLLEPLPEPPHSPRRHLPVQYWIHREEYPHSYTSRSGCVSPPSIKETQLEASFWHRVTSERERAVLVFAAYWDDRAAPLVRLLVHTEIKQPTLRCLFWYYDVADPEKVEASVPLGAETFRVVSCAAPAAPPAHALAAVSLVTADFNCGMPRNILGIQGIPEVGVPPEPAADPRERALRVGACLVWWRRGDAAARLVDWLQLLRHSGVHRVYMYINHNAHDNVLRVVEYFSYKSKLDGLTLDVMPYASPPLAAASDDQGRRGASSSPRRPTADANDFEDYFAVGEESDTKRENSEAPAIRADDILPYNECVYRARGERLAWLALLDIDEAIVPVRDGSWSLLASREARTAVFQLDEPPDVLELPRWWFPELLQDMRSSTTTAATQGASTTRPTNKLVRERRATEAPPAAPSGRIFAYEWRGPASRTDDTVTGKLLRTARVVSAGARGVRCVSDCRLRAVDSAVARVHLYTSRCGGAPRGVCRALRRVAVREDALWRWRRAQQDAARALHLLQLRAHAHSPLDDE